MSLIQQQAQSVSIQYIAFPNQFGTADCVYINDRGQIKKKPLSTVFLNSISFYTVMNPITIGTDVRRSTSSYFDPASTTSVTTPVYFASPFANTVIDVSGTTNGVLQVGSIYWDISGQYFYGYMLVLINLNPEGSPLLSTYVNCLVTGALSTTNASATVVYQNPIILNSIMQVFDPQAPPTIPTGSTNYFPSPYTDPGVANAIRARLRGNIQISFPSGPLYTWLNDQYFSASYSPF